MRQVFLKHVFCSRMWAGDWENTSTWDKNDPCHHEAYCLMTSQRKWRPVLFTDFLFPPWLKCLGFLKYVSKLGHEFQIRDPQYIRGTEWIFVFGILLKDFYLIDERFGMLICCSHIHTCLSLESLRVKMLAAVSWKVLFSIQSSHFMYSFPRMDINHANSAYKSQRKTYLSSLNLTF